MPGTDSNIDSRLVIDFQKGNHKALNQLVKQWHKPFCEKAYWLVKDADVAKDIAQDSWRVIISKIDKLEKPESFGSWGLRIVCNKSIDWLNRNSRLQKHKDQIKYQQTQQVLIEETDDTSLLKEKLLEAFKKIPSHQQIVIKLFYIEDYSLKEISETLCISIGTTKSRLFHAREKLKQLLKRHNNEK